jgi:hypothetical protein
MGFMAAAMSCLFAGSAFATATITITVTGTVKVINRGSEDDVFINDLGLDIPVGGELKSVITFDLNNYGGDATNQWVFLNGANTLDPSSYFTFNANAATPDTYHVDSSSILSWGEHFDGSTAWAESIDEPPSRGRFYLNINVYTPILSAIPDLFAGIFKTPNGPSSTSLCIGCDPSMADAIPGHGDFQFYDDQLPWDVEGTIDTVSISSAQGYADLPQLIGVPEPATWTMMLLGFGGIGWMLRGHRRATVTE